MAETRSFFDAATATATHLVWDAGTGRAALIDPVLDFDAAAGRIETRSADRALAAVEEAGLTLEWVLDTHVHADHMTAAGYVRARTGALYGMGSGVRRVLRTFAPLFGAADVDAAGSAYDALFEDGAAFPIGELRADVMHTPGHTPACVTYLIDGAAFVGDALFMPDYGTGRTDFPGGDAAALYRSIRRILDLPPETRLFVGHDYPPEGREPAWETTVAEERARNVHVRAGVSEAELVALRTARDAGLPPPALMLPALQVNIRAGELPPKDESGRRWLRLPLETSAEW